MGPRPGNNASLDDSFHSGSLGNMESGSERFSAMDDYLDSSIRRYDDQLQFLEAQKARLEAQMSQSSRQNLRTYLFPLTCLGNQRHGPCLMRQTTEPLYVLVSSVVFREPKTSTMLNETDHSWSQD